MPADIQVTFEGLEPSADLRAHVRASIADLARAVGPVTTCRVALTSPDQQHRDGGAYRVEIRLALPEGRHIHVSRTAHADEKPGDSEFAVRDAFQKANQALRDRVRKMTRGGKGPRAQPVEAVDGDAGFVDAANASEITLRRVRRATADGARRSDGNGPPDKPRQD